MPERRPRRSNDGDSASTQTAPRRPPLVGPTADGLVRVGYIAGTHGLHGAIRIRTDDPGSTTIAAVARVFIDTAEGRRRDFNIQGVSALGGGYQRLVLQGVADVGAAEALRGGVVMISITDLPPLGEGEFYYFQLAGAEVILPDGQRLGVIEDIISTGAHDVWVVRVGEREVLVPVISDIVKRMDLGARRVTIEPVPGLLD